MTSDAERFADLIVRFHGLTMNGGFLDSFASHDGPLSDVANGFEFFGLSAAAALVRDGIQIIRAEDTEGAAKRSPRIDSLPPGAAERLEVLGNDYMELVGSDDEIVFGAIERYWESHPDRAPKALRYGAIPETISDTLAEYVGTLARREELGLTRIAEGNALIKRNQALYKKLRETPEGRAGIAALLLDPRVGVRLAAAMHALTWAPERSVEVLEQIARGKGLAAFEAEQVLKQHRAGTLNLDW